MLSWVEEGEQLLKEELSPESPATKALVEQWETLSVQYSMLQKGWEDATTQEHTWLLVVPLSRRADLLQEAHAGVSGGHLGRKKTLCRLHQRLYWVGMMWRNSANCAMYAHEHHCSCNSPALPLRG